MRICLLTPRYPFPENGGDVLRINAIARYLKSKGHYLILVSFIDEYHFVSDSDYKVYDEIVTVRFNKKVSLLNTVLYFLSGRPMQCGFYYSSNFSKKFKGVILKDKPDLYISHMARMETYLRKYHLESKSIVEMTDALSKTYFLSSKSKGISLKKFIYFFEKNRIRKIEKKIIDLYPKVVLVSENDIKYLGNGKSLAFHTNGIDIYENTAEYDPNKICFVGNMRTLQNQEAVTSFVKNIFPLILEKNPNAQFHIVGAEPPAFIKDLANEKNIYVTGFVNSVEEYIQNSCLLVAPVTIAAGIQNKVLIGMGCKIPVVLTSLIAGAITGIKSGENCYIEDDYERFAEKCLLLMNDKDERLKIAENGLELVNDQYSWVKRLEGYENISDK